MQGQGPMEQKCKGKASFVMLPMSTPVSSKIEDVLELEICAVGMKLLPLATF